MSEGKGDVLALDQAAFDRLRRLNAEAVRDSATLVGRAGAAHLARPTPCAAWSLGGLLAHLTAQHRGFAAAALGYGQDLSHWTVQPFGARDLPRYAVVAEQVINAFATVDEPDRALALPEFSTTRTFPAAQAIGFHLIDYVVHSWDVARSLGLDYRPSAELVEAALPIALAVPDTAAARRSPRSAFRPGLPPGAGTLDRILAALGRPPGWQAPDRGLPAGGGGRQRT
jgi:uncharacterized protein (TIGR03086 family)